MRTVLTTLTPEERAVAQQNYWMVDNFLKSQRLPHDEWWDVVIFRYLLTVERWFRQPELYKYGFYTVAWSAMRSAVGNEQKKGKRRIKTVSLDEPIPGTDGLLYGGIITGENLNYIPYITEVGT